MIRPLAAFFLCLAWASGDTLAAGPPLGEDLLRRLVADLGSDVFDTRREAAERLRGHMAAAGVLEKAATSRDPEIRSKAAELLKELDARRAPARCRRMSVLAMEGRLDLLPDHTRRWGLLDPEDLLFKVASRAAAEVFTTANARLSHKAWWRVRDPRNDLLVKSWTAQSLDIKGYARIHGAQLEIERGVTALLVAESARIGSGCGIFLTSDTLTAARTVSGAIIIANGDVNVGRASRCVIISGGAVTSKMFNACIVIARKGIRQTEPLPMGPKIISVAADCVLVSGGKVDVPDLVRKTSHVEEDARRPLGIVRWFEPSDVGLTLDGLKVKALAPGCPLAEAGLRPGDSLLGVDGVPAGDADALRRALRRRYAVGGPGTFSVKRGEQTLTPRAGLGG